MIGKPMATATNYVKKGLFIIEENRKMITGYCDYLAKRNHSVLSSTIPAVCDISDLFFHASVFSDSFKPDKLYLRVTAPKNNLKNSYRLE